MTIWLIRLSLFAAREPATAVRDWLKMDAATLNNTPVEDLKNLGKKSTRMLNEIGILTRGDLEKTGITMAYKILQHRFPDVNILFLYSMYGALSDCHWNHLSPEVKETLREAAATPLDIIPGSLDAK